MNMSHRMELARSGENLAATYLLSNGYKVVYQNFRQPCGEIDLIVEKNQRLVFVEVKTRSYHSMLSALASVSYSKRKRITKTAQLYVNQNPGFANYIFRFDVIVVFYFQATDTYSIKHFEDAFYPVFDDE